MLSLRSYVLMTRRRALVLICAAAATALPAHTAVAPEETTRAIKLAVDTPRSAGVAASNKRVALVIGNGKYPQRPLDNPPRDAAGVAKALDELGFDVIWLDAAKKTPLVNLSRDAMIAAIRQFKTRVAGADVGVVYFAGHGVQIEGQNYLLPVDDRSRFDMTNEDHVKFNSVSLEQMLDALGKDDSGPKVKIVILDACRDNPFSRTRSSGGGGLAPVSPAAGTIVAFATSPGKVAYDGTPGGYGMYTGELLKALHTPGLRIEDIFIMTRAGVYEASKQRQLTWESTSLTGKPLVLREGVTLGGTVVERAPGSERELPSAVRGFEKKAREPRAPFETFKDCDRCPEMVVIPGGTFTLGSPENEAGRRTNESPQKQVTLPRFGVGRFEITFEEWEACLLAGGCAHRPNDQGWGRGKHPVVEVSWDDAKQYVEWLVRITGQRYRLLSEAEWEYVARAGATSARPWGDELGKNNAVCADCAAGAAPQRPLPVTQLLKTQNKWNVAGMLGNVWEWVEDCQNPNHEQARSDGSARLGDCARYGIRGGAWTTAAHGVRSAARSFYPKERRDINIGLRVATTID